MSEMTVTVSNERQVSSVEASVGDLQANGEINRRDGRLVGINLNFTKSAGGHAGNVSLQRETEYNSMSISTAPGGDVDTLYVAAKSIIANIETPA